MVRSCAVRSTNRFCAITNGPVDCYSSDLLWAEISVRWKLDFSRDLGLRFPYCDLGIHGYHGRGRVTEDTVKYCPLIYQFGGRFPLNLAYFPLAVFSVVFLSLLTSHTTGKMKVFALIILAVGFLCAHVAHGQHFAEDKFEFAQPMQRQQEGQSAEAFRMMRARAGGRAHKKAMGWREGSPKTAGILYRI